MAAIVILACYGQMTGPCPTKATKRINALARSGVGIDLEAQMVDSRRTAALRDREVDARIVEHPFGVIVLANSGLGAEQRRVETNAVGQIGHCDVNVKALHAALLLVETARAATR